MFAMSIRGAALSTFIFALAQSVQAQVVVSHPPLFTNGDSNPAELNGGQEADSWTATSGSTITGIRWWGTNTGATGSFTVRIFGNSSGSPGPLLNSFSIGNSFIKSTTGQEDFNGRPLFKYEADLDGGLVQATGTTYWVSIINDATLTGGPNFLWHQGSGGDGLHAFRFQAGAWSSIDGDMAFEFISVPAPGTLAMFSLAALGRRRRRRRD